MREVVHSFSVPVIFGLGIYVFETNPGPVDSASTIFMVVTAVLLHITSREIAWQVKYIIWRRRNRRYSQTKPRRGGKRDFIIWLSIHMSIMFVVFAVLIFILMGLDDEVDNDWFPLLTGMSIGAGIAVITGDLLGGGLIGGFEVWSLYQDRDLSGDFRIVLIVSGTLASLLSLHHGIRTILAVTHIDQSYLRDLKHVRWGWDAHSEMTKNQGGGIIVLATTSTRKPFDRIVYDEDTDDDLTLVETPPSSQELNITGNTHDDLKITETPPTSQELIIDAKEEN